MTEEKLFLAEEFNAANSSTSFTVAASYLNALLQAGQDLSVPRPQSLQAVEISEDEIASPSSRVPLTKFLLLADYLQLQTGRQDIGLVMAQLAKPSTFSALGYAAMSCSTLFEAATLIPRYEDVVVNAGTTELAVKHGLGSISWQGKHPWVNHPVLQDMIVAGWYCFAKWSTSDTEHHPVKARFAHPEPPDLSSFNQLFNCPLEFDADCNELIFNAEYLQEPVAHSDDEFNLLMRQQADSLMHSLQNSDSLIEQVMLILQGTLPKHEANINSVALALNVSERTLRRRLAEQGTSFQQLLMRLRQELSCFYLNHTELSMLDVALLLGYSDQSTFTSAFKSWFQKPPSEWRAQHDKNASIA